MGKERRLETQSWCLAPVALLLMVTHCVMQLGNSDGQALCGETSENRLADCSLRRRHVSLGGMNRSCGVAQPELDFMTHLLLSSSLARYEKPRLCSHMVHRRNAQCAAVKVGAKATLQSGWLLAFH